MNANSRWARAWRCLLRRWFPDRRTTAMVIREIRDREIRSLMDGSAMAALVAAYHQAPSGREAEAKPIPEVAPDPQPPHTEWLGCLGSGYGDQAEAQDDEDFYLRGAWDEDWMEDWPAASHEDETGSGLEPHRWGGGFGSGDAWDLYQDDGGGTGSGMGCGINPATGLPMLDDVGVDVAGNPYGVGEWE